MNTFSQLSYDPAEIKRIEEESSIPCPNCGGRLFETEEVFDDCIKTTLDCEECGYIINNADEE